MEVPLWFEIALERRLDRISAWVERQPEVRRHRMEEKRAFRALFAGADPVQSPAFGEWEDKHHLTRGLENESLYLQGLRDGVQLICALLADPVPPDVE